MTRITPHGYPSLLIAATLAAVACGGSDPTSTEPVDTTGVVQITIASSQVAWSGVPSTTTACAGFANTWYYDLVFVETAGVAVTLTSRVSTTDGVAKPEDALDTPLVVPAHGSVSRKFVACFSGATQHTTQAIYHGTDASTHPITATAPLITFLAKP